MDDVQNKSVLQSESNASRDQYDSMHQLIVSILVWLILVLLIVVSGTLWIFLRWQVKYTSLDLEELRPFIVQYEKATGPAMDSFIYKLADYGRTHPDFAPIMAKYGIKPAPTPGSVTATSAPPVGPLKKK